MFSLGLGQLFFGPVTDKIGRKQTLLIGIGIYLLTSVLVTLTNDFMYHLFYRGLQGIGACAIMVAAFASVADKFNEKESGKLFSYLNGVIFCIPALAPVLGYQLTQKFGWHSNFWFMAAMAIINNFCHFKVFCRN